MEGRKRVRVGAGIIDPQINAAHLLLGESRQRLHVSGHAHVRGKAGHEVGAAGPQQVRSDAHGGGDTPGIARREDDGVAGSQEAVDQGVAEALGPWERRGRAGENERLKCIRIRRKDADGPLAAVAPAL